MRQAAVVIFRSRLHNDPRIFRVVQASVNTGFSALLCTNVTFVTTPLYNKEVAGWMSSLCPLLSPAR